MSVAGGKYTTYRLMARDAVDKAAADLPFASDASRTADIPVLGAVGRAGAGFRLSRHAGAATLSAGQLDHLVARYGTLAEEVLDLLVADPALAAPLAGAESTWPARCATPRCAKARCIWTTCSPAARTSPSRRPTAAGLASEGAARLMAPVLGWDEAAIDREIAHYVARLEAESAAQALLSDVASDAARAGVRDLRLDAYDRGGTSRRPPRCTRQRSRRARSRGGGGNQTPQCARRRPLFSYSVLYPVRQRSSHHATERFASSAKSVATLRA